MLSGDKSDQQRKRVHWRGREKEDLQTSILVQLLGPDWLEAEALPYALVIEVEKVFFLLN